MKLNSLLLALVAIILQATPVLAAPIASPTSYSIQSVTAYSPALETNDQLYIIKFGIAYASNPAEDAGQAWLIRLLEDGIELASTTPYAFYNDGYSTGVASIYLPASMAAAWSGNVTIILEPNPTLSWVSLPPQSIFSAISWDSSTTLSDVAEVVGAKIRALGLTLNVDWSATASPIIESVNGLLKLTARGSSYFDVVIPVLRAMNTDVYQSSVTTPILVDNNYGDTGQTSMDGRLVGTPFDLSNAATVFGLSRMWTTGVLWAVFGIIISGAVAYKAQTVKPAFFLFGGIMVAGGFMGFGLILSVLMVLLGAAAIILAFAWRGA